MPTDDQNREPEHTAESDQSQAPAPEQQPTPAPVVALRRRRFVTKRNAVISGIAIVCLVVGLAIVGFLAYRLGFIDRFLAGQIKNTFAQYGIRAEIGDVHTSFTPRAVEMKNLVLYDSKTGAEIGKIDRLVAQVRIEDMYALHLNRNVNLEYLTLDGLEVWVKFDDQGNSNFRYIHVPPKAENERILFSYSTAVVQITNSLIHYGDNEHRLSGEARNLKVGIAPVIASAPKESPSNTVDLSMSNSTFAYDGREFDNIDVKAHGRSNETRVDLDELYIHSPVVDAHLQGAMDDWTALRYNMQAKATLDLTQISDILQTGTAVRGAGNFEGTVTGEGARYNINGTIDSDALAADGVRLKALNLTANGTGDGKTYDIQGKVVAELLTTGDFQLNALQLAGKVMGTGSDFKWLGDLRAAAAKGPGVTIAGLFLEDAAAEARDGVWTGTSKGVSIARITGSGANAAGARIAGINVKFDNGTTTASANSVQVGNIAAGGGKINGVSTGRVTVENRDGKTQVQVDATKIGSADVAGVQTGSINVAGVRLAIFGGGRVEGSSSDIQVGTVTMNNVGGKDNGVSGKIDNVTLAKPVYVLEPSGRYRASADLSLGGGMIGSMNLGAAHAAVVATNAQYQINNFTADILNGHATGNATISTARNGASHVNSNFTGLDLGNLVGVATGDIVPIGGNATGKVDLSFPGTNFSEASGTISTDFRAEAGDDQSGRTPLTGTIALRADRGLFSIDRANVKTAESELTASGTFSFRTPDSNLQVTLNSRDASELQRLMAASGLFTETNAELSGLGVELKGNLAFNGTVRGSLSDPTIDGRTSLESLTMNGRDLGAFTASLSVTPQEIRIPDGKLAERDGGGLTFAFVAPRQGENNISIDATLDKANGGNLFAALAPTISSGPDKNSALNTLSTLQSDISGHVSVTGIPQAMNGAADIRFDKGSLSGEAFDSIVAKATFKDSVVELQTLNANFKAGVVNASGTINVNTEAFDLAGGAANIQLNRIKALAGDPDQMPDISGTADLTLKASGKLSDFSTWQITFDGQGKDVAINGNAAGALTLTGRTANKQLNVQFTTGLLGQPQVVTASVDLSNERLPSHVETTISNADLASLFALVMPQGTTLKVGGHATGTIKMSGNLLDVDGYPTTAGLAGEAQFSELTVQVEDVPLTATSPLVVKFQSNELSFEKVQFTGQGTNVAIAGTAAIGAGGNQDFSINGKLNLRVLDSLSPNIFLGGQTDVAVRVSGTFEAPKVTGTANINGGSFATLIGDQRLNMTNVKGSLRFDANRAQIEFLSGNLGGGKIVATGGASLVGFVPNQYRFNVTGDNVTLPYPEDFNSTADVNLEINGQRVRDVTSTIISGKVDLKRAQYTQDIELADFLNRRQEQSLTEGSGDSDLATTTRLDLRVEGRDALVIRNNIADVVGSVSLVINGSIDDPSITGRITANRGTVKFRNDTYEVTRAVIDYPPGRGADPIVNLQADADIRGYQVIVGLTGPLSQPQATIRSEPSLPQADVVSLITQGELASNETTPGLLGQPGVGTAASLLTDTLINTPAQKATNKLFGLNRFSIDPFVEGRGGASPTARLTVGRQINKNLLITYSTNVTSAPNQVVALEYRLSNRLSFIAQYEQGQVNNLSTRNDNFSFEIRFQKRF